MPNSPDQYDEHLLVNGLSIGTGGGYTVARDLCRNIAAARDKWLLTLELISDHPLQVKLLEEELPNNCQLHWAPASTAKLLNRKHYESQKLPHWASKNQVTAVLQLNGMVIPKMQPPTLSHHQDPWPYRPEAWNTVGDRWKAALKRRETARSLTGAAACGWTSNYLKGLICGEEGVEPRVSQVFYNGVPESWLERARAGVSDWSNRPLQICTVSNVSVYKRQSMIIEALPRLHKMEGLAGLDYRIIGGCDPGYEQELNDLASSLGVGDHVFVEGRVSNERVEEVLAESRAMVLMSVCESFGIPLIEAMTFGTPVVAADCCALPEVAGEAAEFAEMDNLDSLVEKIANVLTNPQRAAELQTLGVDRSQEFSWANTGAKMADCLDEMLASSAVAAS